MSIVKPKWKNLIDNKCPMDAEPMRHIYGAHECTVCDFSISETVFNNIVNERNQARPPVYEPKDNFEALQNLGYDDKSDDDYDND